jgi:hypothetical protein
MLKDDIDKRNQFKKEDPKKKKQLKEWGLNWHKKWNKMM